FLPGSRGSRVHSPGNVLVVLNSIPLDFEPVRRLANPAVFPEATPVPAHGGGPPRPRAIEPSESATRTVTARGSDSGAPAAAPDCERFGEPCRDAIAREWRCLDAKQPPR